MDGLIIQICLTYNPFNLVGVHYMVIGEISFMISDKERNDGSYRIVNCPKLKSIQIRQFSFWDYHSFELNNLPSLQSIDIGHGCFDWVPSFSLTGLIDGLV